MGVVAVVGGLAIGGHIYGFYQHSDRVGSALIHTEQQAAAVARATGKCVPSFPGSTQSSDAALSAATPGAALAPNAPVNAPAGGTPTVYALLKSSSIGLVAPVVEGVGDSQLSVAVGHVPASSWPGAGGTSVLAAHDVTWFSRVDQLRAGDQISVVTPCETFVYTVADHRVVAADTPIFQSTSPRLVLITCYPLDALFLTSQRYLVDANLTGVLQVESRTATPTSTAAPAVPAPLALALQGLDLAHNTAPMGSLIVTGSPSTTWQQSSRPLDDAAAVVALYFAAVRSAEQNRSDWWAAIAPGVPYTVASQLVGAAIIHNNAVLSPSLVVDGDALSSATLVTEPTLSGNESGNYRIEMTADVVNGQLVLDGWSMRRISG